MPRMTKLHIPGDPVQPLCINKTLYQGERGRCLYGWLVSSCTNKNTLQGCSSEQGCLCLLSRASSPHEMKNLEAESLQGTSHVKETLSFLPNKGGRKSLWLMQQMEALCSMEEIYVHILVLPQVSVWPWASPLIFLSASFSPCVKQDKIVPAPNETPILNWFMNGTIEQGDSCMWTNPFLPVWDQLQGSSCSVHKSFYYLGCNTSHSTNHVLMGMDR